MPDALVERLWSIIQHLAPGKGGAAPGGGGSGDASRPHPTARLDAAIPGLALSNTRGYLKHMDEELVAEGEAKLGGHKQAGGAAGGSGSGALPGPPPGDMPAGTSGRGERERERERERSGGDERSGRGRSRSGSRERRGRDRVVDRRGRDRSGERERRDPRDRDRRDGRDERRRDSRDERSRDERSGRDRSSSRERSKRRRSRSPRAEDFSRRGGGGGGGSFPPPPPPDAAAPMLDEPAMGGVYRGKVSGVMEFGCFVELQGFRRKVGSGQDGGGVESEGQGLGRCLMRVVWGV